MSEPAPPASRVNFRVTGMSCGSCAARLEKVLAAVPGVAEASVNFAQSTASVRFTGGGDVAALVHAVRAAGFEPSVHTIALTIGGMTCAGCAASVEKALRRLPQVVDARVNLALGRADVDVLAGGAEPLIAAVSAAGFTAALARDRGEGGGGGPAAGGGDTLLLAVAALLTLPLVVAMTGSAFGAHWHLSPYLEWALATPVQFLVGARFYRGAWRALRAGSGNMDLLVALGTSAAYVYSAVTVLAAGAAARGALYFEASAVVITLVVLGKWLEERAKRSASAALRQLMALNPATALIERDGGLSEVAVEALRVGDVVVVRPGERVPADGTVIEGTSEVDLSLITGESLPVTIAAGGTIVAGAVNGTGRLRLRVTAVGGDTMLARIIRLVENAQAGKAPMQRLVDRVSAVFVPVVVAIAVITFGAWWGSGAGLETALIAAVSVLVIACPCALGLATPTALLAGTGVAARAGILVRDIEALERTHRIDTVVLDKTGTLTEGRPRVTEVWPARRQDAAALLALAAAVQGGSEHPLARAVVEAAAERRLVVPSARAVQAEPGAGITGEVEGKVVRVGSLAFIAAAGIDVSALQAAADTAHARGHSVMAVARDGEALGVIAVSDPLRPDAAAAIRRLKAGGLRTVLLSGDAEVAALAVGRALGVDEVKGGLLPADKAAWIAGRQAAGRVVAMVGDGLNDAPALAQADVGIAVGGGTDVAMETAGITLMRPEPGLIADAIAISRATWRKIRQNLFWAFVYNTVALPLAAAGMLSPEVAAAAMAMSSLSVVANALTLKAWRPEAAAAAKGAPPPVPLTVARGLARR